MNRTKPLFKLFRFNYYLRRQLLDMMERLSLEELFREALPGVPSVFRLMADMVQAEIYWVQGVIEEQPLEDAESWYQRVRDLPSLKTEAARAAEETLRLLDAVDEEGLLRAERGDPRPGGAVVATVEEILMHVLLHEAHYRGQLALVLQALGVQPPPAAHLAELVRATRVGEF